MRYNLYMIRVDRLIWNKENIAHIAHHEATPREVEEVCHGLFIVRDARAGRVMIIGPTKSERILSIILDPEQEEGSWYPVTARSADRNERKTYIREMEGIA